MQSNSQLFANIETFIANYQQIDSHSKLDFESKQSFAFPSSTKYDSMVSLPSSSIIFIDGELKEWKSI